MFVQNYMTSKPITASVDISILDAAEIMRVSKVRRLPLVDAQGILQGIVTDRDVRQATPSSATTLDKHELSYLLGKLTAKSIMTRNVITIGGEATIVEAALLMYKRRIGGLVIVDAENKVQGIITETDIFKVFVDTMGLLEGKTRLTINANDRIGVLGEISNVFRDLSLNITSIVTTPMKNGKKELVIRADVVDKKELLVEKLREKGFEVTHITEIG